MSLNAIVTGASRGLGRALAAELAEKGANVVLVARQSEELHAAVAEFHRRHARGEVMSEEQLFASFEQAWTNDGFWWPFTSWGDEALLPAWWLVALEEVAGLIACWWVVGQFDLYLPGPRHEFWRSGRLKAVTQ